MKRRIIGFIINFILIFSCFAGVFVGHSGEAVFADEDKEIKVLVWSKNVQSAHGYLAMDLVSTLGSDDLKDLTGATISVDNQINTNAHNFNNLDIPSYGMVVVWMPGSELTQTEIEILIDYVKKGGRVVMHGEFNNYSRNANKYLSAAAAAMGATFSISNDDDLTHAECTMNTDADVMGGQPLANGNIMFKAMARIEYSGKSQVIATSGDKGYAGIVDLAVEKGRITISADTGWWHDVSGAHLKAGKELWARLITNSVQNQKDVEDGEDPNADHRHKLQYSVGENSILAYCTQTKGASICTCQGVENAKIVHYNIPSTAYTGGGIGVVPDSYELTLWNAAAIPAPSISYEVYGDEGWSPIQGLPVNVGKYRATISAGKDDNKAILHMEYSINRLHNTVLHERLDATCTSDGYEKYYSCEDCELLFSDSEADNVISKKTVISKLGHDWTGDWTVIREATELTNGEKELTCKRAGCGAKKYSIIPAYGVKEDNPDPQSGKIEKSAEVTDEAPIDKAVIVSTEEELLASDVFSDEESDAIRNGTDAKLWIVVDKANLDEISIVDKKKIEDKAKEIVGDNAEITYFDATLYKSVGNSEAELVHEPGMNLAVNLTIPDNLLNHDITMVRMYMVLRLHDGEVDVIYGDFDDSTKEFQFLTDRFSTYAIGFMDIEKVLEIDSEDMVFNKKGQQKTINVVLTPETEEQAFDFVSSDERIATVDENGVVTARATGECKITITTKDGAVSKDINISVKLQDKPPKTYDFKYANIWVIMIIAGIGFVAIVTDITFREFK